VSSGFLTELYHGLKVSFWVFDIKMTFIKIELDMESVS